MAHVGILFCLYDHLKQLKEENIMAIVTEELKPAVAYLAGAEAFEVFRNSGTPEDLRGNSRSKR